MVRLNIDINTKIKNLQFATKNLVTTKFLGNYKSVFRGNGLEFEGYRDYTFGDDASLIDWAATKKANKPLVKEFIEERNLDVFFIIDVSSGMLTGSTNKLKSEYAAEMIATIAFSVLNSGDRVGFALFANKLIYDKQLTNNKAQFSFLIDRLINSEEYVSYFNFEEALKYAINYIKKNTIVFVVSDFITPVGWEYNLSLASGKLDIICVVVRDPRDMALPDADLEVSLTDPYTKEQIVINPSKIKKQFEEESKNQLNYVFSEFERNNLDYFMLMTDLGFLEPLIEFFIKRQNKWR